MLHMSSFNLIEGFVETIPENLGLVTNCVIIRKFFIIDSSLNPKKQC